jgi:hypothetical protein
LVCVVGSDAGWCVNHEGVNMRKLFSRNFVG